VRVWLRQAKGEATRHSGKHNPYPAVHVTFQTVIMQDSYPQSVCWSAEIRNMAGVVAFTSSAGLLDRQLTPTLDSSAVRAKRCAW